MKLDGILKAVNRMVSKENSSLTEFVAEIQKGEIHLIKISADIRYAGKGIFKDDVTLTLDAPHDIQGRFYLVGEAFSTSGKKVASFRELISGVTYYGKENFDARIGKFINEANQKLKKVVERIETLSPTLDPDSIIAVPYIYKQGPSIPTKAS